MYVVSVCLVGMIRASHKLNVRIAVPVLIVKRHQFPVHVLAIPNAGSLKECVVRTEQCLKWVDVCIAWQWYCCDVRLVAFTA